MHKKCSSLILAGFLICMSHTIMPWGISFSWNSNPNPASTDVYNPADRYINQTFEKLFSISQQSPEKQSRIDKIKSDIKYKTALIQDLQAEGITDARAEEIIKYYLYDYYTQETNRLIQQEINHKTFPYNPTDLKQKVKQVLSDGIGRVIYHGNKGAAAYFVGPEWEKDFLQTIIQMREEEKRKYMFEPQGQASFGQGQ